MSDETKDGTAAEKVYRFKLAWWPLALPGGRKIRPAHVVGKVGLYATTDKALADRLAKCMGVRTCGEKVWRKMVHRLDLGKRDPLGLSTVHRASKPASPDPASKDPADADDDPQTRGRTDGDGEELERVTREDIIGMTKAEIRELLTDWGEQLPRKKASLGEHQAAAIKALEKGDPDDDPSDAEQVPAGEDATA